MDRVFLVIGAASGFIAVALGAFAAHAPQVSATFEVGVRYQMYHALALFAVAWACTRWPGMLANLAGWLFVAGTLLFSGNLYLLALTGEKWLGAITPLGGLAFLAGWTCLAAAAWPR